MELSKNSYNTDEVSLTGTYTVSVYAKKSGYKNSDTVTKEIQMLYKQGDVTGDGVVNAADIVKLVNIIMGI